MNSVADYSQIENEIANISLIIDTRQKIVSELTSQDISDAYQYKEFVKGQQLNLIRLIKQKIVLENKLQSIHEERFKEFNNCNNSMAGVSDVISLAFQYAHPIDKRTKKYATNGGSVSGSVSNGRGSVSSVSNGRGSVSSVSARSHSSRQIGDDRNNLRVYKEKDRFERFLDFIIAHLIVMKVVCIIALVIIKVVYICTYVLQ
jgi:hypothetical protein